MQTHPPTHAAPAAAPGDSPPAGRGATAILTLPVTGIAGPGDLRGRRLGVPTGEAGASALRAYELALGLAGLALGDADLVGIAPHPLDQRWTGAWDVEANALLRGEVDAVHVTGDTGDAAALAIGARSVVELPRRS
jgi:ABC-type nitrate/sulfonate/bicarbonate transport system substrate-binding protein